MPQKSSTRATVLDQKFWQNFAKNFWEKKPLVLKNVKSALLEMTGDEIFELLVLYANRCRKLKDPTGFKFYIDGFKADADDVLQVLPEKKDKSLEGYHDRMKVLFADYCLVCDELLQVNLKKQHLLTEFTDELYRHVGFPNRFSEMGLYLGNYRQTPFGVHVDSCGVFSFPVAGKKRFRLWTPAFAKKHPELDRAFSYEKLKKNSTVLEAHPGDMTYWPSSAWHIAESDGSFNATWSLGVWVDQPLKNLFSESIKGLLDHKLGPRGEAVTTKFKTLHKSTGEVKDLPQDYQEALAILRRLTPQELEESLLSSWMQHISTQGFKTVSGAEKKISAKTPLQLRSSSSPILWRKSKTQKKLVHFSFGGVTVQSTDTKGFLSLIQSLNAGETCEIRQYLAGHQTKPALQVLQTLSDAGAFR